MITYETEAQGNPNHTLLNCFEQLHYDSYFFKTPYPDRGGGIPALISIIENFLDIDGIATRSGDLLFLKVIGEHDSEKKIASRISVVAMVTKFSSPCLVKYCFFNIFLQILTMYLKQRVILRLEVNYWIFYGTQVTLHVIYDVIDIVQYFSKNPRWRSCICAVSNFQGFSGKFVFENVGNK